jgi:hypothetical protein
MLKPNKKIWRFFKKIVKIFLLRREKKHIFLVILKINLAEFSHKKTKGKRGTWIW